MKKYVAELVGTYALVFCGTGAIVINDISGGAITHPGIGLSFGLVVMIMIYALGSVSGAHINPAVTIAFSLTDRFDKKDLLPYMLAQITGGIMASATLVLLFSEHKTWGTTTPSDTVMQSFVLELILTFFLMMVIIFVSQNPDTTKFTGLAVGATVALEALFAGPICGASMNPARSIAPALMSGSLEHLWIYIAAPIIGSILAVFLWKYLKE